jgi:hypothetical protein
MQLEDSTGWGARFARPMDSCDVNPSNLVLDGSKKTMQIGSGDIQAAGGKGLVAVTFLHGRGCELQLEIPQQPLE